MNCRKNSIWLKAFILELNIQFIYYCIKQTDLWYGIDTVTAFFAIELWVQLQ